MFYVTESDFDDECNILNDSKDFKLLVGYSNSCPQCKKLTYLLEYKRISFACIDIEKNTVFLRNIKMKMKTENIGLPLMLLFQDKKFKKMMNTTMNVVEINAAMRS